MPLKRLAIFNVVLAIGLCTIFLLPKSFGIRNSAIIATLPLSVGNWVGRTDETPELVKKTLAKDTGHHRATYRKEFQRPSGARYPAEVAAFMVVSGADMNSSIHRPERCFPAQGLNIEDRKQFTLEVGPDKAKLPITMLDAVATITKGEFKGKTYRQRAYYWFVGHTDLTNDHWGRTWIDMKDRVVEGYNQRWAYVMLSMNYGYVENDDRGPEELDAILSDLAKELYPKLHKLDQLK